MTDEAEVIEMNPEAPQQPQPQPLTIDAAFGNVKMACDNFVGAPGISPNVQTHAVIQQSLELIRQTLAATIAPPVPNRAARRHPPKPRKATAKK